MKFYPHGMEKYTMARVSNAERTQAAEYIKRAIRADLAQVREEFDPKIQAMREAVRAEVDKETGFSKIRKRIKKYEDQIAKFRDQIAAMEEELGIAVGYESGWGNTREKSFEAMVTEKFDALFDESEIGAVINALKEELAGVDQEVFLATTHEDLASLVRERI